MEVLTTIEEIVIKTCNSCSLPYPLSEFHKDKNKKHGISPYCKICRNASRRKNYVATKKQTLKKTLTWEQANPGKRRGYMLKREYGISLDDFNNMLIDQKGLCKICNNPQQTGRKKTLVVDHCHITGKVRGLLCDNCNKSLGLLKENLDTINNMFIYLQNG